MNAKLFWGYILFGAGIIDQIVSILGIWPKYALFVGIILLAVGAALLSDKND